MREVLPIDSMLAEIADRMSANRVTVLRAAPGAGKTTRVPPALAERFSGRIIMVEPRRVAASGAAERISFEAGRKCGTYAGFVVRGEKCCSSECRILCVTTGIYLNMLLQDPSLDGVSAVIFDEFHERSMQSDLGFTLTLETAKVLRDNLPILVMSATVDEESLKKTVPEAEILDVPGRIFPLTIEHNSDGISIDNLIQCTFRNTIEVLRDHPGNALVFMPGVSEIGKLCSALEDFAVENDIAVFQLHGRMTLKEQNEVLRPEGKRRRLIVATNIAESSVTVPDISIVIDSGYEKRSVHDAASGFDRLETVRISLESAVQRSGRAGRTSAGYVRRLWSRNDEKFLVPTTVSEISECDLAPLALALADWGSSENELSWVTPPDPVRLASARQLLFFLGALDEKNKITARGRRMAELPVHPRISAMLDGCGDSSSMAKLGCETAAVIEEMSGFSGEDTVSGVIHLLRNHPERYLRCSRLARQLQKMTNSERADDLVPEECGKLLMRIFPDRIGQYTGRLYRFSGGGSGVASGVEHPFIVCAAMQGTYNGSGVIRRYEQITRNDIEEEFSGSFKTGSVTVMDGDTGKISASRQTRFGELVLSSSPCSVDPAEAAKSVVAEALRRQISVPDADDKKALHFYHRVIFGAKHGQEEFPKWHDFEVWKDFLMQNIAFAGDIRSFADLKNSDILSLMRNALGYENTILLDRLYPEFFVTPAGARHPIDYSGDVPSVSARCQEFYGVKQHPCVGKERIPLKIDLLSPALRSTQITSDLPGFWKNSWHLVRKDMKSRYPKHDWPEDPENALPHTKVRL